MTETASKTQILMAQLAVVLVVAFMLAGAVWYGLSEEVRHRVWDQLIARPTGPMSFRFILQPVMATLAALRGGIHDARTGRRPYLWAMLSNPLESIGRLDEGVIATARVILLGLIMDIIYQYIVLKTFYPAEAAIVAIALAFVPYVLLRGPIERIAHSWFGVAPAKKGP